MRKRQELVATKISSEAWLRLNDLAARLHLSPYRLVQETIDTLILYMDGSRQLSPDMQMVIDCFERFEGWGQLTRLTDINVDWRVADAIYFCHDDRPNGMIGSVACWKKYSFMGGQDYTFNKVAMFNMILHRLFPELERELGMLALQFSTSSHYDTLKQCIHEMLDDPDKDTLREMFADCGRSEYGRPTELTKYIRHNRKNIETIGTTHKKKVIQQDLFDGAVREEDITPPTPNDYE